MLDGSDARRIAFTCHSMNGATPSVLISCVRFVRILRDWVMISIRFNASSIFSSHRRCRLLHLTCLILVTTSVFNFCAFFSSRADRTVMLARSPASAIAVIKETRSAGAFTSLVLGICITSDGKAMTSRSTAGVRRLLMRSRVQKLGCTARLAHVS